MSVGAVGGGTYGYRGGQGPIQAYAAQPIILGVLAGQENAETAAAKFRVLCGDSRVRVKVSVLFIRLGGVLTPSSSLLGATLWGGEEEDDTSGLGGGKIPSTDILRDSTGAIVHRATPMAIPEDTALDGWTQEVVTSAESLIFDFTTGQGTVADAGPSGTWIAKAKFQPEGQRLPKEDWDHVQRNFGITLLGPEFNLPFVVP